MQTVLSLFIPLYLFTYHFLDITVLRVCMSIVVIIVFYLKKFNLFFEKNNCVNNCIFVIIIKKYSFAICICNINNILFVLIVIITYIKLLL